MGMLFVILSAVLFGLMPLFATQIYILGGNSLTLCLHRFLFSIPFLYLIIKVKYRMSLKVTHRQLGKIAVLSLGCAGTPLLLFQAYRYISSGMATTIHFVYPILVLLGCAVVYHEKITLHKKICAALCVLGIMGFYSPGETGALPGVVLAFLSGVTYAFYVLYYSRGGLSDISSYKLSFYLSAFSSFYVFVIGLFTGNMVLKLPLRAWILSVAFAFMVSVLATVAFQTGTKITGPQKASMLSTFEPLTSVVVGAVLLGETLTLKAAAGIVCILLAVLLLALGDRKTQAE